MNLNRLISVRRARARVFRALTLVLAGLLLTASFQPGRARAGAATPQQSTKLGTPKPKEQVLAPQQIQPVRKEGVKTSSVGNVEPLVTNCANRTPIQPNSTVNGTLAAGDCVLTAIDNTLYDEYTFNANAGQQVSISMTSTAFDTYLYLLKPSETVPNRSTTIQNDDVDPDGRPPNLNSRIPVVGFITLPETGTYSILANVFVGLDGRSTGDYSLTLTFGNTNGTVCPPNPTIINNGQTLTGILDNNDCALQDNTRYDAYSFTANAGQQVSITMTSTAVNGTPGLLDPYLLLLAPDGTDIAENDNGVSPTSRDARIPAGGGVAVLPQTGTYTIYTNSFAVGQTGGYSLTLNIASALCPSTAIGSGTVNGTLANGDCLLPADGSFVDLYTFTGTQGQQISITMAATSGNIDPYLFLLAPNTGRELTFNDNGGGGASARIPATGLFTLPESGTYTIVANTTQAGQTGNYSLTLAGAVTPTCTYTLQQSSISIGAAGGNFSVGYNTQAGCAAPTVASNASWLTATATAPNASGAGTINFSVAANTTTSSRTGALTFANLTFTVTQDGAGCNYSVYPPLRAFGPGASTTGRLTVVTNGSNCPWTAAADVSWITITQGTSGTGTGRVRYSVTANDTSATRTGRITIQGVTHTVTQTATGTTPTVQFSQTVFGVAENDPLNAAIVTLTRTGDTTGAVTVDYATTDDPAEVGCFDAVNNRGAAYARCDYASSIDTVTFAPNETQKSFTIPLINDVHVEGNETFQVRLLGAEGATLGAATATVTITDDDTVQPTTNPIKTTPFFVRLQYLDFLAREPEPGEPWTRVLNNCSNVENNPSCDRLTVSGAFFGSPEFQLKGTLVFLIHKAAFGNANQPNYVPAYVDFAADLRRVTGATAAEVFAKRLDFVEDFVNRAPFVARYGGLSNAAYVDTLLANVNSSLTTADPASGVTRNSLVNDLNANTKTRAEVLRLIVESQEVSQKQLNFTFVATEYYGYLRRTPEAVGYQSWLTYLNTHPGDSRTMVNGFMNSVEYKLRFGPNVP
jgi:hypothetical protein